MKRKEKVNQMLLLSSNGEQGRGRLVFVVARSSPFCVYVNSGERWRCNANAVDYIDVEVLVILVSSVQATLTVSSN